MLNFSALAWYVTPLHPHPHPPTLLLLCMSVLPFICPYNPPNKFSFGVDASIRIGRELRCLPYAEFFVTFFFFTNKSIGQKNWDFFHCHKMYFQRIGPRKFVSKILEENCFKDFGGKFLNRFWRKFVSNILEENSFKDFGGKLFQRFRRKIVSKIWEENCFKDFERFFYFFFYFFLKINHATSPKLYWSYYPHRSRDSLSPVCGIFFIT